MKVGIQNKKGWLILVWNDGKRRTMATGIRADIARFADVCNDTLQSCTAKARICLGMRI
jgi:hypothetical protein